MFDENIKFKYSWRPYQERVLAQAELYLKDKRINIVAAPGSGKTILGLELVRRLKNAVLILAPTVTIKNQWIDRFVSLFVNDNVDKTNMISNNVYELSYFNSVTYQGLHYAYKRTKLVNRKNKEETDDEIETEQVNIDKDIKTYDIIKEIKDKKIKTIVLDEAHHLKSEWWQSLKNILQELDDITIISLTATPPYDIEYNEWKRYTDLCGDIDIEISVPELVAERNLCPHQDYIFFNYPTEEEKMKINNYIEDVKLVIDELKNNNEFIDMIKNHPFILDTDFYIEEILDNVELYSSMIIFLNEVEPKSISSGKVKILGSNTSIPKLNSLWVEKLLQNILFSNVDYFNEHEKIIGVLKNRLNSIGAIEKKQVYLSKNPSLSNYFINSLSKLESINKIVEMEYTNLKDNLRMVILTDFLRKEYIFEQDIEIKKLGVFPIFLNILKASPNINMAVLTGSIFMVPISKKEDLVLALNKKDISKKQVEFITVDKVPTYCMVKCDKKIRNDVMKCISSLFSDGKINIIIGTKSLLGEGWDEPSINSLVLASFVGSYVLSNQMRGRAIRVNNNDKTKTANIWHLVSVLDENYEEIVQNTDFEMLKRRFRSFVGIGYNAKIIINGIKRLDIIPSVFTKDRLAIYNMQLADISNNRKEMYNRWFELLNIYGGQKIQLVDQIETKEKNMKNRFNLVDPRMVLKAILVFCCSQALGYVSKVRWRNLSDLLTYMIICLIITGIFNLKLIVRCIRGIKFSFPEKQFESVVKAVIKSLIEIKVINTEYSKIKIRIKKSIGTGNLNLQLRGLTTQENNRVMECLKEIFNIIGEQRYILQNKTKRVTTYYGVPEVLAVNKEKAEIFLKNWEKYIGNTKLIYTRSIEGRKKLLEARKKTFNYTNENKFLEVKKPLSKWQ